MLERVGHREQKNVHQLYPQVQGETETNAHNRSKTYVAMLTAAPLSTLPSTRRVAYRNTPPQRSRRLHKRLRRRAGSRSAGPARTRCKLHAPEVRAAGPTARAGNIRG